MLIVGTRYAPPVPAALNPLRYGLRAHTLILPNESPADFTELCEDEWQLQSRTEQFYLELPSWLGRSSNVQAQIKPARRLVIAAASLRTQATTEESPWALSQMRISGPLHPRYSLGRYTGQASAWPANTETQTAPCAGARPVSA